MMSRLLTLADQTVAARNTKALEQFVDAVAASDAEKARVYDAALGAVGAIIRAGRPIAVVTREFIASLAEARVGQQAEAAGGGETDA